MSSTEPGPAHAGVIAPPPLIFLGFLAAGWGIGRLLGGTPTGLAPDLLGLIALFALILGVAFLFGAVRGFAQAKTPPQPWKPSTAIVDSGVYRLTRNPMYLGMAMLYAALALWADSLAALAGLIPALAVIHFGVILREERYLEAKFGDEYRRYKAAVRRWI